MRNLTVRHAGPHRVLIRVAPIFPANSSFFKNRANCRSFVRSQCPETATQRSPRSSSRARTHATYSSQTRSATICSLMPSMAESSTSENPNSLAASSAGMRSSPGTLLVQNQKGERCSILDSSFLIELQHHLGVDAACLLGEGLDSL